MWLWKQMHSIIVKRQPVKIHSYPTYLFLTMSYFSMKQQVLHENVSFNILFDAYK